MLILGVALFLAACAEANAPSTGDDACTDGVLCYQDVPTDLGVDVGARDTGVCITNECGGCVQLLGRPGDSCGECGQLVCDGIDDLRCEVGVGNTCGGCASLSQQPGDVCGTCGTTVCDGTEAVRCDDSGQANSCGGCAVLDGVSGQACGDCEAGLWTCRGTDAVICEGDTKNACSGCQVLPANPGDSCGTCGGGIYQCNGQEALSCLGAEQGNACGGCAVLVGVIGDLCGDCMTGELTCNADGSALECVQTVTCDPCAYDANDTIATATVLPDRDDSDNAAITQLGHLSSAADVDVYAVHVEDGAGGTLDITADLKGLSVDFDLCVFLKRDDGDATDVECSEGVASIRDGLQGCCSLNSGTANDSVFVEDNTGGWLFDDSSTVYYVIMSASTDGSCYGYTLEYAF